MIPRSPGTPHQENNTMDADQFDAFVRSLPLVFTRRTTLAGGPGAVLGALLVWTGGDDAEAKKKRRRRKKKKKKRKCKGKGKKRCGQSCCQKAECIGGACCPPSSVCGSACCAAGESCLGGACCSAGKACGTACCDASETCTGGACCPLGQVCGTVCCPAGQRCGDSASGRCVAGQGTCPTGVNSCTVSDPQNFTFCNGNSLCICAQATDGTTRCATPLADIDTPEDCNKCAIDADCAPLFPNVADVFCAANVGAICGCGPGQTLCAAPCPTV